MTGDIGSSGNLFGFDEPGAPLVLQPKPIACRVMIRKSARVAHCEGIEVTCDEPIRALLGAMLAMGLADSAVKIVDSRGHQIGLDESFHEAAAIGRHEAI